MPLNIKKFLENNNLRLKFIFSFSNTYVQETGVLKGRVLSATLFALKVGGITKHIPNDNKFNDSLYVDDVQIGYHHPDINTILEKLQQSINNTQKWTT